MRPLDLEPGEAVLHEGDPSRCAVVLPGVRYFSQAPLLWFAREAAQAQGWSVLELSERAPGGEDPFDWMRDRAGRALERAGAPTVAVIGKSLASAAAPLAVERALPAVWLTPLLGRPEVASALAAVSRPTLIVGSPADPAWGEAEPPSAALLEVMELEGLDHSLQVEGNPEASLARLGEITAAIGGFLGRLA